MPSNIDKAFIDNLQNFTTSLENIVELLKQQSEKGDAVNKMLSTMDGPKLSDISEDIKEILNVSKNVDNRTKEILEEVKAAKKQKETGLFGKIDDKDNKKKIVTGVETILLIAGGVLAIGMAFKIIGRVDPLSVVALSVGILAISKAFSEVAEVKNLTPRKTLTTGLAIVIMAGALTLSSLLLQHFKPLSIPQILSLAVVGAALGTASYLIFKSVSKMKLKPKDMWKILLMPVMLPAIALGITLSSEILSKMRPIGLIQSFSTIFVGLSLAAGAFAVSMVIKALKDKSGRINPEGVLLALTLIPAIAGGIVLASIAFQAFKKIDKPLDLILGSISMGIAILAFAPSVWLLGKMNLKQLALGSLGVVLVSGAILASSLILNFGKYENQPPLKWAAGVGLSLLLFSPSVILLGVVATSGVGVLAVAAGAGLTILLASTITLISHILNKGDFDSYPSAKWAAGVGLSMILFSPSLIVLGVIAMTGVGLLAMAAGAGLTILIASTIVSVSHILNKGDFNSYPSAKWAAGVGLSMLAFFPAILSLGLIGLISSKPIRKGAELMKTLAQSIVDVSIILNSGKFTGGPTEEWSKGISNALVPFVDVFELINKRRSTRREGAEGFGDFMTIIASSMITVANVLGSYDWKSVSNYPSKQWGEGVGSALLPFTDLYEVINERRRTRRSGGEGFSEFVTIIGNSMISVAKILGNYDWSSAKYPEKKWGEGISSALLPFIDLMETINSTRRTRRRGAEGISDFMIVVSRSMVDVSKILKDGDFTNAPNKNWSDNLAYSIKMFNESVTNIDRKKIRDFKRFIDVINDFSKAAEKLSNTGIDKLNKLTASVTIMSVIDDSKLKSVIKVLDENKKEIGNIIEGSNRVTPEQRQTPIVVNTPSTPVSTTQQNREKKILDKFDVVINKFDQLLDFVIQDKIPESTGRSESTRSNWFRRN